MSAPRLIFTVRTHVGQQRASNEDAHGHFETPNGLAYVVCDGMGGHAAGMTAARVAVDSIGQYLHDGHHPQPGQTVAEALRFANKRVYDLAQSSHLYWGMGTTAVMALYLDGQFYLGHIGDSRIYHQTANGLHLMTRDHSLVQDLITQGKLPTDEARHHPQRHIVTRAVGTDPDVEPEVRSEALILSEGEILLLCSDGLTEMLTDAEIATHLADPALSLSAKADKLIEAANEAGGRDNITVLLVQH